MMTWGEMVDTLIGKRTCMGCGQSFCATPARWGKPHGRQMYCTKKCRQHSSAVSNEKRKYYRRNRTRLLAKAKTYRLNNLKQIRITAKRRYNERKRPKRQSTCKICGAVFTPLRINSVCCGKTCYRKARAAKESAAYKQKDSATRWYNRHPQKASAAHKRYYLLNRGKRIRSANIYGHDQRLYLRDSYVRHAFVRRKPHLQSIEISPQIIKLKRSQLLLFRAIKKYRKERTKCT